MLKTLIPAILLSLWTASFANAQEKSSGPRIRALILAPAGATIELHTIVPGSGKISGSILVGATGVSDPIMPGARIFSFAIPDKTRETGFRAVSDVTLPAAGDDFIVLLEPAGETFKNHVVAGNEPRFKNDSTLFFNATDAQIGVTLGKGKLVIPPRKPVMAEAPPQGERPWYQVTFYELNADGSPRIFANTRWPHRKSSRCYLFLYRSQASGGISYHAVDESIVPAANQPQQ